MEATIKRNRIIGELGKGIYWKLNNSPVSDLTSNQATVIG